MFNKKLPKKEQLEFLDWEFGVFFHFGIRTFYEGHKDWDMKGMPIEVFNPSDLDCEQWINTIAEAGAKYAILVCKHHDGFANWPSRYTDYSVENTPWKNGKGDVVRDFVDTCRKHSIKVGLYYSPAEFGSSSKSSKDYDDYFINQISELLANYGIIDYLWFDGNGSENHKYDEKRIIDVIRGLQPNILIFNMWDADTRWVGNESGYANMPNFSVVNSLDFSVQASNKETLECARFLPVECDFRMRRHNWFYSDGDESTVKSLEELMGIYYYSVGRGANLLINIGPDRRGLLPKKDSERLIEFGNEIRKRFSKPLSCELSKNGNVYTCRLESPQLINHVVLKENLIYGGAVEKYSLKAYPYNYGEPILVYESKTIGHKAICEFPNFYTDRIDVIIHESKEEPMIDEVSVYFI